MDMRDHRGGTQRMKVWETLCWALLEALQLKTCVF